MGLSCCGRTGGPHGRVSTEVGRLTRFHREFKRNVVQELLKGEKTLAEVSRELDIQPSAAKSCEQASSADMEGPAVKGVVCASSISRSTLTSVTFSR
jgi:transposase-like protein